MAGTVARRDNPEPSAGRADELTSHFAEREENTSCNDTEGRFGPDGSPA